MCVSLLLSVLAYNLSFYCHYNWGVFFGTGLIIDLYKKWQDYTMFKACLDKIKEDFYKASFGIPSSRGAHSSFSSLKTAAELISP